MAKLDKLPADDPHPREAGQTEHRDSSAHSSAWERVRSHVQSANLNTRYLKLQVCFIFLQIIRPFFFLRPRFTNICLHTYLWGGLKKVIGKHWTTPSQSGWQGVSTRANDQLQTSGQQLHWSDRTKFWFTYLRFTQICHLYSLKDMSSWWSVDNDNPYFQSIFLGISYGFMFLDFFRIHFKSWIDDFLCL